MKKVIFKNALVALILTVGFLFSGAVDSNAQVVTSTDPMGTVLLLPSGSFVDANEAKDILLAEMSTIKAQWATLTPPLSYVLKIKLDYYLGIYTSLQAGKDVPTAIVDGLGAIRYKLDQPITVTPQQMSNLKTEAINLLK